MHVVDASLSVPAVESLLDPSRKDEFDAKNRASQDRDRTNFAGMQADAETGAVCRSTVAPVRERLGDCRHSHAGVSWTKVLNDYPLEELVPDIDWSPFFYYVGVEGQIPANFRRRHRRGLEAKKLYDDARTLLDRIIKEKLLTARGVYGFWKATLVGDDVVVQTATAPVSEFVPVSKEPCGSLSNTWWPAMRSCQLIGRRLPKSRRSSARPSPRGVQPHAAGPSSLPGDRASHHQIPRGSRTALGLRRR